MENNTATFTVKLSFNGEMRRFPLNGISFTALYEQIISLLGLETNADLLLKYTDEHGDLIAMSSDEELKSALRAGQLLRVVAAYKNKDEVPVSSTSEQGCPRESGCRRPHGECSGKKAWKARKFCKKMWLGVPLDSNVGCHPRASFGRHHQGSFGRHGCGRRPHGPFGHHHPHPHGHAHPHGPVGHQSCGNSENLVARFAKKVTLEDGTEVTPDNLVPLIDAVLSNGHLRDVKRRKVFRLLWKFGGNKEKVVDALTKKLAWKAEKRARKQTACDLKN